MKRIPRILLTIEDSRAYGRGLLRGIGKYARIHGPWVFQTRPEFYHGGSHGGTRLADLKHAQIDGVITRELKPDDMKRILALGAPVIVASHMTLEPELPSIMTDCAQIGSMAAHHFLDRGFSHFAYCGLEEMFWSRRRARSFAGVLEEAGFDTHTYRQPRAKTNRLWGKEQFILTQWLEQLPKPVAILACTDDRARDLVEACEIAGLRVPEDVAILGVDNDELVCDLAGVPISSVALNVQKAGFEAAELLDALMRGEQVKQKVVPVIPTRIEIRRSTDILAIEDGQVAKALDYINNHVNEPLQVSDVARAVALTERNLFERFQQVLGRSVRDQITRVRVARICWMLENTTLSLLEIALAMGLPDDKHLARYFARQKNMTPSAWRRKHFTSF
jgi:LacI family transcriptional regulator